MPHPSLLRRPIIDVMRLPIPLYEAKILDVVEETTKMCTILSHMDNKVKYMEIQPIEATHALIFTDGRKLGGQYPKMNESIQSSRNKDSLRD